MPVLRKINVIFLYVCDLEKCREFYENKVGFNPPVRQTAEWVEYDLPEGTNFALHRSLPECMAGSNPSRNTIKFSIVVDDLQEAWMEMEAKGVYFTRAPEKGFGFELAEFEDPEGNQLRLIQYTAPHVPS